MYHDNPNEPVIVQILYPNRNPKIIQRFLNNKLNNDMKDGIIIPAVVSYYINGNIESIRYYKNGILSNTKYNLAYTSYTEDGKLEFQSSFIDGKLESVLVNNLILPAWCNFRTNKVRYCMKGIDCNFIYHYLNKKTKCYINSKFTNNYINVYERQYN